MNTTGDVTFESEVQFSDGLTVWDDVVLHDGLAVGGNATVNGRLNVGTGLYVDGPLSAFEGKLSMNDEGLVVAEDVHVVLHGPLTVTNTVNVTGSDVIITDASLQVS